MVALLEAVGGDGGVRLWRSVVLGRRVLLVGEVTPLPSPLPLNPQREISWKVDTPAC